MKLKLPILAMMLAIMAALCTGSPAFAATASASGTREGIFIAEIMILLFVGRGLGEVMQRLGQPAITGQLIAGILLGPSFFGAFWPEAQKFIFPSTPDQKSMIDAVSQLGILLLLLLTGMETDLKLVRRVGSASAIISATGILVPFVCGFALGEYLPASILPHTSRLVPALFLGTALSISSVKIVAMVVREMNFMRRDLGQVIVASAIIEDTIGWVIIAITLGIATRGAVDFLSLAKTLAGIAVFMGLSFTIGRRIVFNLIRWANDNFQSEFPVITMILLIMGVMAEITQLLGVHTVLGAFVSGILIGESPILTQHIEDQLRGIVSALFMPVFFGLAGLSADLTILKDVNLLMLTCGLIAVASVGKFAGAFIGGEIGGLSRKQAMAVGAAMNARGSTEVIVATIGLSMGALTQNLFTMIVTMAIITTTVMPPMLRSALSRIPMDKNEKERVEREALDRRGFVGKIERLLLAVDDSAVGKFTARIAGLIAGARGVPITIVHFKDETAQAEAEGPDREVKEGAEKSAGAVMKDDSEPDPDKVHLTTRVTNDTGAVKEEARKGFDLMMIGVEDGRGEEDTLSPRLTRFTEGFDGALGIVVAHGAKDLPALTSQSRILVPINGTAPSRRAAEVALAIARSTNASVTALYVSSSATNERKRATRRSEEAMLKDIVELGERYNAKLRTALKPRVAAEAAILTEAAHGYGIIIMGISQRPGSELFLGTTPTAILSKWKGAVLFVVS
ncbi:MAG TPA: cation:proton antiporter [Rhizomicrobium sp.]|nr:cation:proton antiporter [Rhizomicrobium sp.]